ETRPSTSADTRRMASSQNLMENFRRCGRRSPAPNAAARRRTWAACVGSGIASGPDAYVALTRPGNRFELQRFGAVEKRGEKRPCPDGMRSRFATRLYHWEIMLRCPNVIIRV